MLPFDLARARESAASFSGFTMGASNPLADEKFLVLPKEWLSFDDSRFTMAVNKTPL